MMTDAINKLPFTDILGTTLSFLNVDIEICFTAYKPHGKAK